MPATNTWAIGTFYIQPNGFNGQWTQPNGPGTQVFPADVVGGAYLSTTPFTEQSGNMLAGCGHSLLYPTLFRDVDVTNDDEAIMCVCCSKCSFLQYVLPVELALSTVYNPITII